MDAHTVEVQLATGGTRRLTAKHILLAQGGRPVKAPIQGNVSQHRTAATYHAAGMLCPLPSSGWLLSMMWDTESCRIRHCACPACSFRCTHPADLGTHISLQAFPLPSSCHVLELPGHLQEHAITSDHALSLPMMPKRIVIVGAGYIAVEFSGIFSGMGADVSD